MLASPAPNGHKKMGFWGRSAKWAQKEGFWGRRTSPSLNGLRKRDFRSATHQKWAQKGGFWAQKGGFWVSHASEMGSERGILGQPRGASVKRAQKWVFWGSARGKTGTESVILGASFWERHAAPAQNGFRKRLFGTGAKEKRRRKRTQEAAFGVGLASPARTELPKRGLGPA